ncbi:hypothetical protein [Nitratidesulfovibrio liaohensis]|uniref:Uncharacterized protein n=1 Tax=Nitratidesulfovibrio liaohensis TaxID=2604158 RepID=A0ABY9QXZ1_9BACT|nr:hypothetical protein [Nitratidesulfovibrio liaohensis]WMW64390.1 hypothetical protein KPS_002402 [Nitratidesulfovibrio liaohensis]
MSSYYWPESLPKRPEMDGSTETMPNTWISTPVESGPPARRKRWTLQIIPLTASYLLTTEQVDVLDAFFETVGQASFWFPDWKNVAGEPRLAFIVPADERSLYSKAQQGRRWSVTLSLMIWP